MATATLQQTLVRLRVPLGLLIGGLALVMATPRWWTLLAGSLIALWGVAWRAWASGHLRKNQTLAVSGPYAYTRNPLYWGSMFLGLGFSGATARPVIVVLFLLFFLTVYLPVMRTEAAHMLQLFPQQYPQYAANVPMFWPRWSPWSGATKQPFDRQLYWRYREYRALLGTLAAIALLVVRIYYREGN
jgi:protein-S-isoprenylcysteine O-methyltransferase Ste14